ncbi:MAG TPA: sugar transferase [Bryobacteraceae bacterium]|nr:sugar transferase [Bryobacteraceae bacterium]
MFSRHYRKVKALFGLSDVVLTAIAFEAAYLSRVWLPFDNLFYLSASHKALMLGFSVLTWLALGIWLNVYDKLDSGDPRSIMRNSLKQTLFGIVGVILLQYAVRLETPLSRSFLALFATYSWILLCLFRMSAGNVVGLIRREFGAPHYVMVVGTGTSARQLGQALEHSARHGICLLGFLSEGDAPRTVELQKVYPVRPLGDLKALLREQVIDDLLFAVESNCIAGLEDVLVLCDEEGVRTRMMVDFFPHVNSEVYLDRLGSIPLLTFAAAPHDEIKLFVKRVTDVLLAAAALAVLSPLMALIVALIRFTSPGPVIFRQERCGLNGRRFTFYKFRSMCANAEQMKAELEYLNERETAFKIADDPRITTIGRWIRKFSIDELPQLWNVLKGDMSLVGPRPAVPCEVDHYKGWQRRRLRMRPGLTCLWALKGRDHLDFETWMKMDMQYIDTWSLALDWKIMLRTVPKVLLGKGAH